MVVPSVRVNLLRWGVVPAGESVVDRRGERREGVRAGGDEDAARARPESQPLPRDELKP